MQLTTEQINQLTKDSYEHDHHAQLTLGRYYLEKGKCSNSNFEKAQKFLKMTAEKHQKEGIELLIDLYLKYIKYLLESDVKNFKKIKMYFNLATKWCQIAIKEGINIEQKQKLVIELYEKSTQNDSRVDVNYKLKKKIIIYLILCCFLSLSFLGVSFLKITDVYDNLYLFLFSIIFSSLFLLSAIALLVMYINICKNKTIQAVLEEEKELTDNKKPVNMSTLAPNSSYIDKLKLIFGFDNVERKDLTIEQRGKLGEIYIEYLNYKQVKFINTFIQNKLNKYNEKLTKIEWANNIVESTDPFDFILYTESGKKFYMDVKTSIGNSNKIHLSSFQEQFIKNVINAKSTYIICRITNFIYKNVDDFLTKNRCVKIYFYDLNEKTDKEKLEVFSGFQQQKPN